MKKYLVLLSLLLATSVWAADVKITDMTADTSPTTDDIFPTVNDPASSKGNRKVALGDAMKVWNLGTFASPKTDNPYALADVDSKNVMLWYGATGEIDLPAAVAGMNICIYNTGAFTITIDPNSTDVIVRDGTAQTGGVSMTLSSGAGNYVCLVSDVANHWVTLGYKGTLAAGS